MLEMQSQSRVLDDLAKLLTNAAGAAQGVRQEIESLVRQQAERMVADLELVTRDEFEIVRSMAVDMAEKNARLVERIEKLEKSKNSRADKRRASKPKPKTKR